jgi:AcrR family transcriptional regulator
LFVTSAREQLLARLVEEVARHGLRDRSLRELAAAAGTSHRMVLYHFGSREGLVAEIVGAVEAAQRALMADLATTVDSPPALVRAMWRRLSAPEMHPFIRLFLEVASYSPGADRLTSPWLDESENVTAGFGRPHDRAETRLGVAVVRGLLIDVVSGADVADATTSLELFLSMWENVSDRNRSRRGAQLT